LHEAWLRRVVCIFFLATSFGASADDPDSIDSGILADTRRPDLEQLTGFVVDRTVTNFGGVFFRFFSDAWREQPGIEDLDVTVVERPSARFGSVVYVEHNNRPVARVFLYAGRSATIKPLAAEAARYVATQLSDNALAGLLFNDPDIAKDELK